MAHTSSDVVADWRHQTKRPGRLSDRAVNLRINWLIIFRYDAMGMMGG